MEEILKQLGGLLLNAIPTVVLLLVTFAAYQVLVHGPLTRVLQERHRQGRGAIEKAQADIAIADARTAEYEARMREARTGVFELQEKRRQSLQQARAEAIAEARAHAESLVQQARTALETEQAGARKALQGESETLAQQIIQVILRPAASSGGPQA